MTDPPTADQFRKWVIEGDRESLCAGLAALDEKQRQLLANDAIVIAVPINEGWGPSGLKPEYISDDADGSRKTLLQDLGSQKYVDWRVPRWTANLLVAGLCNQDVFLKAWNYGLSWFRADLADMPERLLQILLARKPEWLKRWLEKEWKQEAPIPNGYVEAGLIQAGLINLEPSQGLLNRMGDDTMERFPSDASKTDKPQKQRHTMIQKFASDPELWGRCIWSIFEHDSDLVRYSFEKWGKALRDLSRGGTLDRAELLRRSLKGMNLPLSSLTLTGMSKLHKQLAPSIEEQEQHQAEYLALLNASETSVIKLALETCESLLKAKRLDEVSFLDSLPSVFRIDKKTPPMKALSITKKLTKHDRQLEAQAAEAIASGLQHINTDVQEACFKFLSSLPTPINNATQSIVARLRDSVAPSLQSQVDQLLSIDTATVESPATIPNPKQKAAATSNPVAVVESVHSATNASRGSDRNDSIVELHQRATELPKVIQRSSQISSALDQLPSGDPLTIEPLQPHLIPRRDPTRQVTPVESVEELVELIAITIESIHDVMDLERILDGISKFRAQPMASFEQRTAPLKKRIVKLSEPHTGKFLDEAMAIGFTQLLMTWLDMPVVERDRSVHWYDMRGWFLRARIASVKESIEMSRNEDRRKREGQRPLLALPTHEGGWLDPVVLVQRINEHYVEHHELVCYFDLAQAMLRLTPDGRADALAQLAGSDRDFGGHYNGGSILRYALGDSCELKSFGGWGSEAAMVAAVRAHQAVEPDATAVYPFARAGYRSDQSIAVEGALTEDPTVPFSLAEKAMSIDPYCTRVVAPGDRNSWRETWESLTNPFDTQASCMAGHLGHLLDSEATWTYAACRLFVVAASDDRGENRVFATDGLLVGIAHSLVSPPLLGRAIAETLPFIKLNRFSKVLGEASLESNLHRWVIAEAIEHALSMIDELPKDVHLLLSLLLEAKTALGLSLHEPTANKLSGISGSSKTGQLAKRLLALTTAKEGYEALNAAILATLVARGERWQTLSSEAMTPTS